MHEFALSLLAMCAAAAVAQAAPGTAAPRSDACALHVDFENFTDGVFAPLNAGVVTVGMHEIMKPPLAEGRASVLDDFAFEGRRCLALRNTTAKERLRVAVQKRFDAPECAENSVIEVVFRPVSEGSVDLREWAIWDARAETGGPVGLKLIASGAATEDVYQVDVIEGDRSKSAGNAAREPLRREAVIEGLKQTEWTRFILHRRGEDEEVALWAGPPGEERSVGTFTDLHAAAAFHHADLGSDSRESVGSGYWDSIRVGRPLALGAEPLPGEPRLRDVGAAIPVPPDVIEVGQQKQLFVDDWIVEKMTGLTRTLHPVQKHPRNPLVVGDKPWEGGMALLYGAVIRDPGTGEFRMWYLAWNSYHAAREGRPEEKSFVCYATSTDGLTWQKPELGLYEFRGSKQNNIVIGYGMSNTTIFLDPRDPDPARRYKGAIRHNGTRAYFSADGIHWRDGGILLRQCYDSTSVHWDPFRKRWMASVKIIADGKRTRGYAESDDFGHWSDTYYMATVDERDEPGDQVYAMTVFPYETALLGLWRMYHAGTTHKVDIQLAVSRNGTHWERPLRTPLIPTSDPEGSWDYGNNAPSTESPIRMGDELWFYYSGRSADHIGRPAEPATGSIGLGTLRLDGFVSVDASTEPGTLLTRPLRLARGVLHVNADADGGRLEAEIVDEAGKPIPPFTFANCRAATVDSVRQPLTWQGADELPESAVRLRFRLSNARLYAFWVEPLGG